MHNEDRYKEIRKTIAARVNDYARSINDADTDAAEQIWSTSDDVTLIHPRSHEHGWDQVKTEFYEKTMRDRFSQRHLEVFDLSIYPYESVVIVEFYWVFDAVFRIDGSAHQTKGRETQVFHDVNGQWLLKHVHYSGMPVTGEREGF
ncbi:MAG: nuclear transport factor 2 family protein [Anaerolineae bacterium]|nr:nuclear transport factor 2 family protein [Anaerolineae bacterium]